MNQDFERLIRTITIEEVKRILPPDDEAVKILDALNKRGQKPLDPRISLSEAFYRATDQQKEVIKDSVYVHIFLSNDVINAS